MSADRSERLYAAYGSAIFARCMTILGDRALAEDATQETFLKVHQHLLSRPADMGSFGWMFQIATNLCLSMIRDRKPQGELSAELPASGNLEETLSNRDVARRLMQRVPKRYSLPAWLHHVDGLKVEEIAELTGVSRRTISNRLIRFERAARKFLQASPRGGG